METLLTILDLISFGICCALIFSLIFFTRDDRTLNFLIGVAVACGLWSVILLIRENNIIPDVDPALLIQLGQTFSFALALALFFMIQTSISYRSDFQKTAILGLALIATIAVGFAIWLPDTELSFQAENASSTMNRMTSESGLVWILAILILALTAWLILNTDETAVKRFQLPIVAIVVGYIVGYVLGEPSISSVTSALALGFIVYQFMRQEITRTSQELTEEIDVLKRDLQQAVSQLSTQRSKKRQLEEDIDVANRHKTEFLANMSHELRTPLNSIVGYSELLRDQIYGSLEDQQLDPVNRIYRNGKHLTGLISGIIDLNKIDADRFQLITEPFDMRELIEEAVCVDFV